MASGGTPLVWLRGGRSAGCGPGRDRCRPAPERLPKPERARGSEPLSHESGRRSSPPGRAREASPRAAPGRERGGRDIRSDRRRPPRRLPHGGPQGKRRPPRTPPGTGTTPPTPAPAVRSGAFSIPESRRPHPAWPLAGRTQRSNPAHRASPNNISPSRQGANLPVPRPPRGAAGASRRPEPGRPNDPCDSPAPLPGAAKEPPRKTPPRWRNRAGESPWGR